MSDRGWLPRSRNDVGGSEMTNQEGRAAKPSFSKDAKPWPYLQSSERLKVVGAYINLGWSVIPVRADKAPALSEWARYQQERPSLEDWTCWLEGKPSNGVRPYWTA